MGNQTKLIGLFKEAIRIFSPKICPVCERELLPFEVAICSHCLASLPLSYNWQYDNDIVKERFNQSNLISKVITLLLYTESVKQMIWQFKYHRQLKIGVVLSQHLTTVLLSTALLQKRENELTIITPVPLHWRKKMKRGFNQSEEIARTISKASSVSILKLLRRQRFTPTQTHLHKLERFRNVENAFAINYRAVAKLKGLLHGNSTLSVLLIDDVLTTGATIEASASKIKTYIENTLSVRCKVYVATLALATY